MRPPLCILALALSLPLLAGCGQTGPLYHPAVAGQPDEDVEAVSAEGPETVTP
jgi:predicted small lipoprotein YifL